MLNQIRYYHAIVDCGSFTKAADECNISQSAISQQIQALEAELGVKLLDRQKRKVVMTSAGRHFYMRTVNMVRDYDQLVDETRRIGKEERASLRIAYPLTYGGDEFQLAIADFVKKYPDVDVHILTGSHEEIFHYLVLEGTDLAISDQRRVFNEDFNNVVLRENACYVEISRQNPLAKYEHLTARDLKDMPCIVICSEGQEEHEMTYYSTIFGFQNEYVFARTMKEARMIAVANRGFIPVDGEPYLSHFDMTIARVPFFAGGRQFKRNLCMFWKMDNSGYYIEEFSEMLEKRFHQS